MYVTTMSYKAVDPWNLKEIFESYVKSYLPSNSSEILSKVDWNHWLFGTGMPKYGNAEFIDDKIRNALYLADYYIDHQSGPANKTIYNSFIADLKVIFVRELLDRKENVTLKALAEIEKDFSVSTKEMNPELLAPWIKLLTLKKVPGIDESTKKFLQRYGRMKYIVPIYGAFKEADRKEYGWNLYQELKPKYHPIARRVIEATFADSEVNVHLD